MAPEKIIPVESALEPLENLSLGMNTVDSPKLLAANTWQLIENAFPGLSGKPRNGMNEKMSSTSALNYGSAHGMFRPGGVYMSAGGKDFIFTLTRCVTTNHTDEYQLEVWNITDSTRTVLEAFQAASTVAYFGFTKLYNALYFVIDQAISTNHTSAYRTLPAKIVEYVGSAWTVREMGITPAPVMNQIQTGDAELANFSINLIGHTSLVFANKMWIFGGYNAVGGYNYGVYSSDDGVTWRLVANNIFGNAAVSAAALLYNNKMWVIGGNFTKKVLYSSNGINWLEAGTDSLPYIVSQHGALVYNNKMWIFGGRISGSPITDSKKVYSSSDGITWTEAGTNSLPIDLDAMATLVYNNKMWIFGGYAASLGGGGYRRKVYSSSDGVTWTEAGTDALPAGTLNMTALSFSSKMWLIGGTRGGGGIRNVYSSSDGVTWTEAGTNALPVGKFYHTSLWYENKMWAICGYDNTGTGTKTIYSSLDGITWTQAIGGITANLYTDIAFTFVKLASTLTGNQVVFTEPIIESIEDLSQRQSVKMLCTTATGTLLIPMPPTAQAIAQGATHIRIWRTLGNSDSTIAAGLSHLYLCDIDLTNAADSIYHDITTDAALTGQTNAIDVTGNTTPPAGRFIIFAGGRLIIGGNPSNPGYWFGSMLPLNVASPQKYASLFNPLTGYITCDPYDGQADTGCAQVGGDLVLFKERKIFVLDNSDFNNVPRKISNTIGCCYPETIRLADIPSLGGQCILFVSESGPAIILPGLTVRLLTEFRIAELWPLMGKAGVQLLANGTATTAYSRNKVSSAFFNNTWWILWGDSADTTSQLNTPKIFGFTFGNEDSTIGAFSVTIPQYVTGGNSYTIFEPQLLVVMDNLRAIAFSHKTNASSAVKYRAVQWLDPSEWQDTYVTEGAVSYSMAFRSRYIYNGPHRWTRAQLKVLVCHLYFQDTSGLTITIYADGTRLTVPATFTQVRQSGVAADNTFRHYVAVLPHADDIFGDFFDFLLSKVVPSTGAVEFFGGEFIVESLSSSGTLFEFLSGTSSPTGSTEFVVKADAVPEVDAHTV